MRVTTYAFAFLVLACSSGCPSSDHEPAAAPDAATCDGECEAALSACEDDCDQRANLVDAGGCAVDRQDPVECKRGCAEALEALPAACLRAFAAFHACEASHHAECHCPDEYDDLQACENP